MKSSAILKDDAARRKVDAMARSFTKTNRVLTGLPIFCSVVDDPAHEAPSWTDGRTITFNLAVIGSVSSIEDIIRLTGLDLHEVAHVLYTPRDSSRMVRAVRNQGIFSSFNALEDQRIETLLTAKYASSVAYLVSTFMRYCLMHPQSWEVNFPLMHGRYYLPKDVRAEFTRRFAKPELIPQFVAIIDEYRKMVLPLDEDRALELVQMYHALLNDMSNSGLTPEDPNGCCTGGRPVMVQDGFPVSEKEQQAASDLSDAYDDAFNGEDADDDDSDPATDSVRNDEADPSTNAPADPDADADGAGDEDGDGDKGQDGEGSDSPSDSEGEAGDSGLTGDGVGTGTPPPRPEPEPLDDDELRDLMEDYVKAYESLDEVQQDALDKQRTIVRGDGQITSRLPEGAYDNTPVKEDAAMSVRQFSKELDRLRADSDPGWATHRASGRINVKRAIQGSPLTELWDEWDAGHNDACDIEAVILVDDSGSMSGREIEQASKAMWIIKRAMEKVDASVTVLTFGEESRIVYGRSERASRGTYKDITANGRVTQPREAIVEAIRVLSATRRTNRIFIVITDGRWDSNNRGDHVSPLTDDQLIKAMGDRGITTAIANVGGYGLTGHQCHVVKRLDSAADLADFAKQIVTQSIIQKEKG